MAISVSLAHRTSYGFDGPAVLGPHVVRLRPAPHCRTPIESYSLTVGPERAYVNWQQDPFGNHLARIVVPEPVTSFEIRVDLVADLTVINPLDFFVEDYATTFPFAYPPGLAADLAPYRRPVLEPGADGIGPLLRGWLRRSGLADASNTPTVSFLAELNRAVAGSVQYSVRMEDGVQSPEQTLGRSVGSCRDSAWLLVALARELGWAARFVSGYLVQLSPDVVDELNPIEKDFTDLHAWAEVFVPGAGWIGLDATSGLFAGEGHIPLSATPAPAESAPITGTASKLATMGYEHSVRRIVDRPRATKPYSDAQWAAVLDLGAAVDSRLLEDDVRLTMGGEPTFVSATDTNAAEWNIAADGADKRARAGELADRLKAHYAPGGVMTHGQGKWYPGEALPRWQIAITWRTDGIPLWRDPALLAAPWSAETVPVDDPTAATEIAGRLAHAIAAQVGVGSEFVLPVFEDRLQSVVAETQLPAGDPPTADVDGAAGSADTRAALIAELDADAGEPAGWIMPLHRSEDGTQWATARWRTRRSRVTLVAGTSPIGMRLPLSSITWTPAPGQPDPSPFVDAGALPDLSDPPLVEPALIVDAADAPPTAVTVEARGGRLYVFLPPITDVDVAVALLTAIEAASARVGTPVVLEGYPVPVDARLQTFTVTPDPGVIEVNVQPARSWTDLVSITETLDTAARQSGLTADKFGLDGSHVGTGGGSHLTLGGVTPADSPLLRRPSLLISLLTFWQNHPALSYLFSGRFIGPTSQAPRVDEARHESLYELEIAFAELDRIGENARPWDIDRALRHLLTDITGNTHRAEFCIDKLFSPDSERGRLGLLELRGFEMPPHPQMSLVQALLVRALVARFWREPYRAPLVRWGTELHDRFLLPSYVERDIADVIADLNRHGIAFDAAWLTPFLEFRFPRLGHITIAGVDVELRAAIEPWHVLGEQATAAGTARYVDSSLERIEIDMRNGVPGRHTLRVNGVAVPLHALENAQIAGVRFRAWAPYSALHPTIGVQSPLTVEVFDEWSGAALGGARYHVVHPGGRAFTRVPVNAGEAEARRAARFVPGGHVERPDIDRPYAPAALEYPVTFDLRRAGPNPTETDASTA